MDIGTRIRLFTALTLVAVFGGIYLVTTQGPVLTTVGVILVIAAAVLFMADVKDLLVSIDGEYSDRTTS